MKIHFDRWIDFMTIFVLALSVRSLFIYQWLGTPYAPLPYLDAKAYDDWALAIANGQLFRSTAFYQSPLYPYAIASVYWVFGHSPNLISGVQAVLGSATCSILGHWTSRTFNSRVAGFATGVLAASYKPLIFFCAPLMKETLSLFLITIFLVCSLDGRAFGTGIALGLATLTRSNFAVLGLLSLWRSWQQRRQILPLVAIGLTSALLLIPSAWHNYKQSGDLILINYTGGFNFFVGHWLGANGRNSYPPGISTDPIQEERDTTLIAYQQGQATSPAQVSNFWFNQGWRYIIHNPIHEVRLLAIKTFNLFSNDEIPDNYDIEFIYKVFPTILSWPLPGFGLIFALSILGLLSHWKTRETRWLFVYALVYIFTVLPFYVTDRYRLPLVIFLFPMAGAGVSWMLHTWKHPRRLVLPMAAALFAAAISFSPSQADRRPLDAYGWGFLAGQYSDLNLDREAIEALQRGFQIDKQSVTARALIKASTSYERLGRLDEAEQALKDAVEWYPHDGLTYYNLARFRLEHNDPKDAERLFKVAIQVSPNLHQPFIGLGVLALQSGKLDQAKDWALKGLSLDPTSPELNEILRRANSMAP